MSDQDLGGIEGALWSFPMNNNNKNHSGLLTKMYCISVRSKKYVAAISFLMNHLFTSVLTSLRSSSMLLLMALQLTMWPLQPHSNQWNSVTKLEWLCIMSCLCVSFWKYIKYWKTGTQSKRKSWHHSTTRSLKLQKEPSQHLSQPGGQDHPTGSQKYSISQDLKEEAIKYVDV